MSLLKLLMWTRQAGGAGGGQIKIKKENLSTVNSGGRNQK